MRSLILAAALCGVSATALAQYAGTQSLPPCNAQTNGNLLIVQRPPTPEEIAEQAAARPPGAQPVVIISDYVTCDGATGTYSLSAKSIFFRSG